MGGTGVETLLVAVVLALAVLWGVLRIRRGLRSPSRGTPVCPGCGSCGDGSPDGCPGAPGTAPRPPGRRLSPGRAAASAR